MHRGLRSPDAGLDAVRTVSKGLLSLLVLRSSDHCAVEGVVLGWMGILLSLGPRHGCPGLETSMVCFGWAMGEMHFAPSGKMTDAGGMIAGSEAEGAGQA